MPSATLIGLQSQGARKHMSIHNPRSQALQVAQTNEPQLNSRSVAQAYEPVAMLCQKPMWNQVLPANELSSCHDDYADNADMNQAFTNQLECMALGCRPQSDDAWHDLTIRLGGL